MRAKIFFLSSADWRYYRTLYIRENGGVGLRLTEAEIETSVHALATGTVIPTTITLSTYAFLSNVAFIVSTRTSLT